MCQIIVREYEKENIKLFEKDIENIQKFKKLLSIKGGSDEGYSVLILINDTNNDRCFEYRGDSFREIYEKVQTDLKSILDLKNPSKIILGLFSRQRPEMEAGRVNISPYINKNLNKTFFVHGTISNDKELFKELTKDSDIHLTVDTEIFNFLNKNSFKKLEGLFSYIEIDRKTLKVKMVDKGMGKYEGYYKGIKTYSTTNIFTKRGRNLAMVPKKKVFKNKTISLKIAFSGGMDSVLNTYKIFSDLEKKLEKLTSYNIETELTYFEYGCNAEDDEMVAAKKFLDYLKDKKLFRSLNINLYRENISGIINNISGVSGEKSKLLDKDAVGNKAEAEDTLAYVPFRNTLMTQILVAQSQKEFDTWEAYPEDFLIMVGLGLNLSDGQVYGDNNITWLEHTENMLKYGGKRFSNVKLLSPYINRTKINMLKEFKEEFGEEVLKELLNISFSCYYPVNGEACGECGSCLLRKEAVNQNK
jgi:7-cyano-7-deazaguanine synthase in queuosine biosynthesis